MQRRVRHSEVRVVLNGIIECSVQWHGMGILGMNSSSHQGEQAAPGKLMARKDCTSNPYFKEEQASIP